MDTFSAELFIEKRKKKEKKNFTAPLILLMLVYENVDSTQMCTRGDRTFLAGSSMALTNLAESTEVERIVSVRPSLNMRREALS